jgi:hypothetical protein
MARVGVEDEEHVQRPAEHRVGLVARLGHLPHHGQEVLGEALRVVRIDERHTDAVAVTGRRQGRYLGDQPYDLLLPDLRVLDLLGLGVEGRQGADPGQEHPHGVGVVVECVDEPLPEVFVDVRVVADVVGPRLELVDRRQLTVDEQVGHLQVGGPGSQLFDRVAAVAQDARVAVQIGDGTRGQGGAHEGRVVEPDPREEFSQVVRSNPSVDDRDFHDLAAAVVGDGDRFSHCAP